MRQHHAIKTAVAVGLGAVAVVLASATTALAQDTRGYDSFTGGGGSAGDPPGLAFTGISLEGALLVGLGLVAAGLALSMLRKPRGADQT